MLQFLCGQLFDRNLLLLTCHVLPFHPMPPAAPSCSINLTTKKRSRLFDQSSSEYCNFYCIYLESLHLTCHILLLLLTCLPVASIKEPKVEAGHKTTPVVSAAIFIVTIQLELSVPDLPYSATPPDYELQSPLIQSFCPIMTSIYHNEDSFVMR